MDTDKTTKAGTWYRRPTVFLNAAAIAYVFAATPVNATGTESSREASNRSCAGAARASQRINLSSGVYTERAVASSPLYLDIPIGNDTHFYEECLQREGFAPRDQVSAEFARVAACNRTTNRKVVLARRAPGTVHIASNIDAPAYSRCIDAAIMVEAELPPAAE